MHVQIVIFLVFLFFFSQYSFLHNLEAEQVFLLNNHKPPDEKFQALPSVKREQICNKNQKENQNSLLCIAIRYSEFASQ